MNVEQTWANVPRKNLIRLLGKKGDGFHPRDIVEPEWIVRKFGVPFELLPVEEIIADESVGIVLYRNGKPVRAMQGVVAGDLIESIARGLGVKTPQDAPSGYSGRRMRLALAIVEHLRNRPGEKEVQT